VQSPVDLAAHGTALRDRPRHEDHAGVILRRYADCWIRGDLDGLVDCYGDDFTLHYAGTSRFAGTHRGRDAALAVMAEVSVLAPRRLVSVVDVLVSDHGGALVVTEVLSRDGDEAVLERVLRYRVRGERLVECWLHETDQDLVDRLWR
jgi:ketosteroid isomerase-like protein